jgi:hypothetical protein
MYSIVLRAGAAWARVIAVALALLPLLLVVLAFLPCLLILPFLRGGQKRADTILRRLTQWTKVILTCMQPSG